MKNIIRTIPLLGIALLCLFLEGCSYLPILQPHGPIGEEEKQLIIIAFALMLIVVIPVYIMALWFSIKYRASRKANDHVREWDSLWVDVVIWVVPILIVIALSWLTWVKTHELDPYKDLQPSAEIIDVEVVSLDWKWLFVYPDQQVAVVNELVFPVDVPVRFRLTSNSVMSSFFIPALGSQIYTMAGMQTWLNLKADNSGIYEGQNQQFSGRGYAGMHFPVRVVSKDEFQQWLNNARQKATPLDLAAFEVLATPSEDEPVQYFSPVEKDLFINVIAKFNPEMAQMMSGEEGHEMSMPGAGKMTMPMQHSTGDQPMSESHHHVEGH